jgi:integrase
MAKGYGAGTVFPVTKIRDGKPVTVYVAMWERPPENGQRRRGTRVADTEAGAWRRMREAQRAEGRTSSRSPRQTESVGSFLDGWLRDVVAKVRRERTLVGYRAIVSAVPESIRSTQLDSVALGHAIQVWLNGLDRHPRTLHHYAACLRSAFGYAVRKGMMERNPASGLDLPAIPRTERIPLDAAKLEAFLAATRDDPLHSLWVTAAWTGMRQGELLGLRWQDVDLERNRIDVRSSLTRLPGRHGVRYVITEPKTKTSRRMVPLLPDVTESLRAVRKRQLERPGKLDQGLVFCTDAGSPLDAAKVSRAFTRAVEDAGMPRVRFHDLRHGAVSLMMERGVDLATISAIIGHSSIATTVDMYGHLTDQHKAAAMARLVEAR